MLSQKSERYIRSSGTEGCQIFFCIDAFHFVRSELSNAGIINFSSITNCETLRRLFYLIQIIIL